MLTDTTASPHARVTPLDFDKVRWTGGLWRERFETCANSTVPQLQRMFESKDISHVLENFRICAGDAEGDFDGTVFGDGDFYKWMEAAMYAAVLTDNKPLLDQLEGYAELITRAQQADGYISTKQIIGERLANGVARMGDVNDFEVYNFGHLFTAACLYKRLTGRDSLMKPALRAAGYLEKLYAEASRTGEVQTAVCPSHYMGLVELYRTTGEKKYLALAEQAIALRDGVQNGLDDNQDRLPLRKHGAIIGHAVRANYLYAGVADLCAEKDDPALRAMLDRVWRSLMDKKLYITGGCGALYNGASPYGNFFKHQLVHQAYGYEYQLPNITAYNETCASVGGIYWAYRMFLLTPRAEYMDALERMLLNTVLAAVSLDGKRFFYENMLRRSKKLDYKLVWPLSRSEYILSYCCPPNLARTIAQAQEYAYATSADAVWTGLYGESSADFSLENGAAFTLTQKTGYPFDGRIEFAFTNIEREIPFLLNLRIPAWAQGATLCVNGREQAAVPGEYCAVRVETLAGTQITLDLAMHPRLTVANGMVEEDAGQAAMEYGPLVYCVESPDTGAEALEDILLDPAAPMRRVDYEVEGRHMAAFEAEEYCIDRTGYDRSALYQTLQYGGRSRVRVRFIPYYAWDNRGKTGEMRIWFPVAYE